MKLFKKLAAAALAAVLALSMVGCGVAKAITASELLNILSDVMLTENITIEQSDDMERLAEKLAANIDKAEDKEATVVERLTDPKVVAAAGIDVEKEIYMVSAIENYAFKSPFTSDDSKVEWMLMNLMDDKEIVCGENVENPDQTFYSAKKEAAGIATVKIDGKEYFVVVAKPIK